MEVGLAEAIKALREELSAAKGAGDVGQEWMRFQIGVVNLELQLVVSKDANGKVGWKVVEVGGAVGSERTQKVTLSLTPQWWDPTMKAFTTDYLVSGMLPGDPVPPGPGVEPDPEDGA